MQTAREKLISLSTTLNEMSIFVLEEIRLNGLDRIADFSTKHHYKNFERMSLSQSLIARLDHWMPQIDVHRMAIELFVVHDDTTEIHYHRDAYAVITILGPWEGVDEPEGAVFYFGSKEIAYPAKSMLTLQVVPGTLHGFRSPKGAKPLTFLSVQSKRIEADYHPVG